MVKALSNGTIDVALPLFRDYWLAEQKGVVQSNPMGTVSLTAIHSSNNLNRDLKKIACTQSAIVNRLELESLFPDATITEYPNDDAVAVEKSERIRFLRRVRCGGISACRERFAGIDDALIDNSQQLGLAARN